MRRIILALLLVFPFSGYGQTAKYILDGNDNVKIEFFHSTNVLVISNAIFTNSSSFRNALSLGSTWLTNTNVTNFRTAIGLGSAATNASTDFLPASTTLINLASNNAINLTNFPALLLRTNGSAAGLTNFPTLNQNTTGTATNVTGVVALANGGTGANNATNARSNLGLGTAATNDASAFQPASANLTNLASNNGSGLTNISISSTNIVDSTTIGRSLMTAETAAAGRSALGGTSFGGAIFVASSASARPTLIASILGFGTTNNLGFDSSLTNLWTATSATSAATAIGLSWSGLTNTNASTFQVALFDSSSLNAQNQRITNLAAPVNDGDAATRAYVFGLFSRVAPSVSFGNTVGNVQIGSTVTTVPLSWSISPTNTPVVFQSLTPVGLISTSLRATNITGTFTSDTNWTLVVSDGTGLPGSTVTNSTSIAFRHYMSWGIASTTTLDNSQIQNLHTNTAAGAGREFRTGKGKSVSISGNGQYIYFAYPATFGAASFIVNGSPNTAWISNTITYTNFSGNVSQFLVYRSIDLMFGTSIPITLN